jgi:hypothetical protein
MDGQRAQVPRVKAALTWREEPDAVSLYNIKAACQVREFSTFEIAGESARMQLKRTVDNNWKRLSVDGRQLDWRPFLTHQ